MTPPRVNKPFAWSEDENRLPTALIYLRVSTTRQARSGGEAEGYSIPAQREACRRKAEELGATVLDEYVDAGASARSADRPALQALLVRLSEQRDAGYVIVHKVDRLARNRIDDVQIGLAIHAAGAALLSATEQIDGTPQGMLVHGIMATVSESTRRICPSRPRRGCGKKRSSVEHRPTRRSATSTRERSWTGDRSRRS